MEIDHFTKKIDKLWISALRGFDPNNIEFKRIGELKRQTTRPLWELWKKTDSREYIVTPDNKQIDLDYQMLCGWTGTGYMNTYDGYDSERYKAFNKGYLGEEPPKNPMDLSFKEALEIYGGLGRYGDLSLLGRYHDGKEAYDLGVEMIAKWPNFLQGEF